jgi:hypothetical protein
MGLTRVAHLGTFHPFVKIFRTTAAENLTPGGAGSAGRQAPNHLYKDHPAAPAPAFWSAAAQGALAEDLSAATGICC